MLNRFLYRSYRYFYKSAMWREAHWTSTGYMVFLIVAAAAILGNNTFRSMIYQVFTFSALMLLTAMLWAWFFRGKFRISRRLPKFASADAPFQFRLTVHNLTAKAQKGLIVREIPDDPRPALDTLVQTPEPDEAHRNAWDRRTLWYRWQWLIQKNRQIQVTSHHIPNLPPSGSVEITGEITPLRRGPLSLHGVTIACPDPFGLFRAVKRIPHRQQVLVLPKRYALPDITLPGSRKYQSGGMALAASIGNAHEFVSLRDYRPGDPLRQIHWKSWARFDKPIVKEFEDEFMARHALILDTFVPRPEQGIRARDFEEAISVAASFASTVETRESVLDLMFIGADAYIFSAGRGLGHTDKIMEVLASVTFCDDKPFASIMPLVINHAAALSGCICVFIAWDPPRQELARQLHVLGIPTLILIITNETLSETAHPETPVIRLRAGNIQEDLMAAGMHWHRKTHHPKPH